MSKYPKGYKPSDEDDTDKYLDWLGRHVNDPPPPPSNTSGGGWGCVVAALCGGSIISVLSTTLNLWYN